MDDVIDLDAMVEAAWCTFQREFAVALGELPPMRHLLVSADDCQEGSLAVLSVIALRGVEEIRLVLVLNRWRARSLPLTEPEFSGVQTLGLRRSEGSAAHYWLVLPVEERIRAAGVTTALLRDVFSVIHPAFLKNGGFAVR